MRVLLGLIITLIIAVLVGLLVQFDSGYVLINFDQWQLESSLWVFLFLCVLFFLSISFLLRFLHNSLMLPGKIKAWRRHSKQRQAFQKTQQGLCALLQGHFARAEKLLIRVAPQSNFAFLNYLSAAYCAAKQRNFDRQNDYLRAAHRACPKEQVAILLTQAQLQLGNKQYEQALATLKELNQKYPQHPLVLISLQKAYWELKDFHSLATLLPKLRRQNLLKPALQEKLEQETYTACLRDNLSLEQLKEFWNHLPKTCHQNPTLVLIYSKQLIQRRQPELAFDLIKDILKRHWHSELVILYGQTSPQDTNKQMKQAKEWLKKHNQDYALLLYLGQLSYDQELVGQAKRFYEASLAVKPTHRAFSALAKIHEQAGELKQALQCYEKALSVLGD